MKAPYTKKQVADIVEIPYRSVQFFTEQGVVVPGNMDASGRGRFRLYSNRDLVSLLIARELANYGVTVGEIKKVVGDYNELMPEYINVIKMNGSETWRKYLEDSDVPPLGLIGDIDMNYGKGRRGIGRKLWINGSAKLDEGGVARIMLFLCTNGEGEKLLYKNVWKIGEKWDSSYKDREGNIVEPSEIDRFWGANVPPGSLIFIPMTYYLRRIQERIG